jgi:hypothetical protein
LAVLNAANGAILIDDQRVWIHFNIFAVYSRPSCVEAYEYTTCADIIRVCLGFLRCRLCGGLSSSGTSITAAITQ